MKFNLPAQTSITMKKLFPVIDVFNSQAQTSVEGGGHIALLGQYSTSESLSGLGGGVVFYDTEAQTLAWQAVRALALHGVNIKTNFLMLI